MMPWKDYSLNELERLYDNRGAVPGHGEILRSWTAESARFRANNGGQFDLAYGDHPRQRLDFFASNPQSPLHIFIHGGYWRALSKDMFSFLAEPFLQEGYSFAAINYPLCPDSNLDEIVASVNRALQWLGEQHAELGFDRDQVTLSGHSAGGHLVAMALLANKLAVRKAMAISAVFELEPLLSLSVNADLRMNRDVAQRNSPQLLRLPAEVDFSIAYGTAETAEFQRQSIDYVRTRSNDAVGLKLVPVAGANHFEIVDALRYGGVLLQRLMAA